MQEKGINAPAPWELTRSMSTDEFKEIMLDCLESYLDSLPHLSDGEIDIEDIFDAQPGIYRLQSKPSLTVLQNPALFSENSPEIGIFLIKNRWLFVKGAKERQEVELPIQLSVLQRSALFQLDLHSHPGNDPGSRQPSDQDTDKLNSTIDGCNYIVSSTGLHEYKLPANLPGGFSNPNKVNQAWTHWIVNDLKLGEEEFSSRGGWALKEEFFRQYFGLRTIPWENAAAIQEIIDKKEALSTNKPNE